MTDLTDPDANAVKLRVMWWTKAPRQHEMLTSYDNVLRAIQQVLGRGPRHIPKPLEERHSRLLSNQEIIIEG